MLLFFDHSGEPTPPIKAISLIMFDLRSPHPVEGFISPFAPQATYVAVTQRQRTLSVLIVTNQRCWHVAIMDIGKNIPDGQADAILEAEQIVTAT